MNIKKGFSLVEVILAMALFMIFSSAVVKGLISGLDSNRLSGEQAKAKAYAVEGLEAIRSVRNQNFASLTNASPTPGVARVGNLWSYTGSNNVFDTKYNRTVVVSTVNRNASGDIVPAPTGTLDPNTKKVESKVSWNFTTARSEEVSLTTYLTNWRAAIASAGNFSPMMVYSKTTALPYYRIWNGTTWGAESTANVVGGNINFMKLAVSRTRNEAVMATLDSNSNLYAQVWDGTSWGNAINVNTAASGVDKRSFDMAYEKNSDRLIFVYRTAGAATNLSYKIWDGSTWSAAVVIPVPTTGVVSWVDVAANPVSTSNELSFILIDANSDVYGMVWDGTSWNDMGVNTVWDPNGSTFTAKSIDVEYEQNTGKAMFMWGTSTSGSISYRTWNGLGLSNISPLSIPAMGGVVNWMELVARPNSNELMLGVVDAGADLNTRKWSGGAWDTATQHAEHSAAVENITSMVFDLVWETHANNSGKAWLVWGNGTAVSAKQWSGTAWGAATAITGTDDTSYVKLDAIPTTGEIFTGIYESSTSATDDILEYHLTSGGTAWSAKNTIWGGPTSVDPVYFRIDFGYR